MDKYLFRDVERAKRETKKNKVILIGHSLGGLLGRAYTAYFSPSSVDKLIMIATPNLGVANAYYFWSGGKIPYSKVEDNILYNGLKMGFILYFTLFKNISYLEVLRNLFPVARDLLPSLKYGNYLFYEEDGIKRGVAIESMAAKNIFLNKVDEKYIAPNRIITVAGTGVYTTKEFLVDIDDNYSITWEDGRPIKAYKTNHGDGTVTTFSALGNLRGKNIIIKGDHVEILYKSKDFLASILGKPLIESIRVKGNEIQKIHVS